MPRCNFCSKSGFSNLDEVTLHQISVNRNGKPICPKLAEWNCTIDPHKAEPLYPTKILGRKYAPKNHDGIYMMYNSKGQISKTKLVKYLLS